MEAPYGRRHAALRGSVHDSLTPRMVGRHAFISLITPALFTKLLTEKGGLRKGLIFETLGPNATWRAPPGEAAGASTAGGALSPAAASESAQANSGGLANGIQSDDGVYSSIRAARPLGLTVRFAPNSGAKADILGPPLRANERTRLRGSALRAGVRGNDGGPN